MLQHCNYTTPDRAHGYCVDDNARALVVACKYEALRRDGRSLDLIQTYLAFLLHAFNRESGRFRNFMSFDRKWSEEVGSEDSHCRAIWGLGFGVKYAPNDAIRNMATRLFSDALPAIENLSSPRSWAFALIGIHAYLEVFSGDASVRRLRNALSSRLMELFEKNWDRDWPWCEDVITYDNARMPHALILSGQWVPDPKMHQIGIDALKWLLKLQTAPQGHLSVIGNANWFKRGSAPPKFDQQPVEVLALIEACAEAFHSTGERSWLFEAQRCLSWFLGQNDLNAPLYDFKTGGCSDGLTPYGPSGNQGAESLVSWLLSILTIYEITGSLLLKEAPAKETV